MPTMITPYHGTKIADRLLDIIKQTMWLNFHIKNMRISVTSSVWFQIKKKKEVCGRNQRTCEA